MRRSTTITRRTGFAALGCALAIWTSGCAGPDLAEQREQLEAEHAERMEQLEALEIRLVAVGARQRAWSELQDRHTRISAIACENAAEHVSAMERHDQKQREKRRRARPVRLQGARAEAKAVQADVSAASN